MTLFGRNTHGLEWRPHSEENGHKWEAGYREDIMVAIRCAKCGTTPIEVLRKDFTTAPCMTAEGLTR
jgi:hypothetical protein